MKDCSTDERPRQETLCRRQWTDEYVEHPETLMSRGGSRKKYLGGLVPHHLGGNYEQNYCVQLSSIKQLMYRNYPENLGGPGPDLGGLCPPGPYLEPPLQQTHLCQPQPAALSPSGRWDNGRMCQ